MGHPVLLCYNIREDRARRISLIAMQHDVRIRHVKPEEYNQTIAALLNMEEPVLAEYEGEGFDREMFVIANFPPATLNKFLNAFRTARIPPVKLKCVLTENNREWSSLRLQEELLQEEIYFQAIRLGNKKQKGTAHSVIFPAKDEEK